MFAWTWIKNTTGLKKTKGTITVENPRHLEDQDVVEAPRVVVLEDLDHVLDQLHVHVLKATSGAIEHQGHLIAVVFPKNKQIKIAIALKTSTRFITLILHMQKTPYLLGSKYQ